MAGAEAMEAIRSMESLCDLIADSLRQPCSGEESKGMVEDLFRECEKQRPKLEEIAMAVIDQENGEKTFNEITAALDRFERLREQKEAWAHASPGGGGGGGGGGGMQMSPVPPQALSGSGAFGGMPFSAVGDDLAAAAAPPQPSPIMSQAASSAGDFENLPQRTSGSDPMKKDKKKKEKKDKKRKSDGTDEFGFLPPASNSSLAPEAAAAASSAFGAWPPSNSQQLDPEASGSAAWGASGAGLGAGGADAAWPSAAASGGDGGGGFGSWGAPSAAAGGSGPVGGAGGAVDGLGTGSNSVGFGKFGDSGWHMDVAGMAEGSGTNGKSQPASGVRRGSPQQATLHIQRPFREVEHDKKGFEKLFTTEVAKALGVPSHRIHVTAIRPGS